MGEAQDLSSSEELSNHVRVFAAKHSLSGREREVFNLLVGEITASEDIAVQLKVSRNTVRNHFQNIFQKTKTNSKTQLLACFINHAFPKASLVTSV